MSHFTDLAHQYIDGEWKPGSGSWDIIDFNPYTGEKLASITVATVAEVDRAYRAAERAQTAWAETNPYTRRLVFERALRIVEDREEEIAETIVAELGGTRLKAAFELHLAKEFLREAVQLALRPEGRILPSPVDGKENRVYRVPVGVVGVISPSTSPSSSRSSRSRPPSRSATPSSSSPTRTLRSAAAPSSPRSWRRPGSRPAC